jgi:hypothetical protein
VAWCSDWLGQPDKEFEKCLEAFGFSGSPDDYAELGECCASFPEGVFDGRAVCTQGIQYCANLLTGNLTGVDESLYQRCVDFCDGGEGNPGWCTEFWKGGGEEDQKLRECIGGTWESNWERAGECCVGSEASLCLTATKACEAALDGKGTGNSYFDQNKNGMEKACEAYCDKQDKDARPDWCPGLSAGAIAGIVIACIVGVGVIVAVIAMTVLKKGPCQSQSKFSYSGGNLSEGDKEKV